MHDANASMTNMTEYQVDGESINEWLRNCRSRALHALNSEPQISAHETAVSDGDNSSLLTYERHTAGKITTRPCQPESANAQAITMQIEFNDIPGFGWWSREVTRPQRGQLNLSMTGLRFSDEGHREGFIKLSQDHAAYCWGAEPDTLIYSGGVVANYTESGLDIKTGDIIFIMGCTDEAAVQKHLEDPKHVALGYQLYDAGIRLTPTFSKSYRTTGEGFFYKPAT